jgi:hypothetical protein
MTWFEEGLQAHKKAHEDELHKKNAPRWLSEAVESIHEAWNNENSLAGQARVDASICDRELYITAQNTRLGRYKPEDGFVKFFPMADLGAKFDKKSLRTESEFQQHLVSLVWETVWRQ